jgi:transposase
LSSERQRRRLPEAEQATLKAAVDTLARLTAELESTQTTLARVQRILFGSPSERTAAVLGRREAASPPADARRVRRQRPAKRPPPVRRQRRTADTDPRREKKKRPGHGRNGADDYPRAPRIAVAHATLEARRSLPRVGL